MAMRLLTASAPKYATRARRERRAEKKSALSLSMILFYKGTLIIIQALPEIYNPKRLRF
jgi:hypothetical protein